MPESTTLAALSSIGTIEFVDGLNVLQTLIPRKTTEAPPNTYSGNFGTNDFPLHTDLAHWAIPPRYLALRCIKGQESVATRILDGRRVVNNFGIDVLRNVLVQPRRPLTNGKQLLNLLDRIALTQQLRLRWDWLYLVPATRQSKVVLVEIGDFLNHSTPTELVLKALGDTIVIDNWRCLHGRAAIPAKAQARHVDRAYMSSIL